MTNTQKTMLPDVAAYFAEDTDRQKAYIEARDAYRAYRDERDQKLYDLREASDKAHAEWQASTKDWSKLTESKDPVVKWIGDNCREYCDYAEHVLRILPATYDELQELARQHDWCGEWDALLRRAVRAGVITAPVRTEAFTETADYLRRNYGGRALQTRLANVVAAERLAAVEEYKAELAAQAAASETTAPASTEA